MWHLVWKSYFHHSVHVITTNDPTWHKSVQIQESPSKFQTKQTCARFVILNGDNSGLISPEWKTYNTRPRALLCNQQTKVIYLLKALNSPVNHTESPQGFSLVQTLPKSNNINSSHNKISPSKISLLLFVHPSRWPLTSLVSRLRSAFPEMTGEPGHEMYVLPHNHLRGTWT